MVSLWFRCGFAMISRWSRGGFEVVSRGGVGGFCNGDDRHVQGLLHAVWNDIDREGARATEDDRCSVLSDKNGRLPCAEFIMQHGAGKMNDKHCRHMKHEECTRNQSEIGEEPFHQN